jgi:threonine/homoserine/homoserine lactone efflux protein
VGGVIGDILPQAVGVAISPLPIIAVILLLLAPRGGIASAAFALTWVVTMVVVTLIVSAVASTAGLGDSGESSSTTTSWINVAFGALLLLIGVRQWRARPKSDDEVRLPKWMAAMDKVTPRKALSLGFLLSAVNPKNLILMAGAGVSIGAGELSAAQTSLAIAVFVVVGASSIYGPVLAYAVAHERLQHSLNELRRWLVGNNAVIMAVLLLFVGVSRIGKGIGGL